MSATGDAGDGPTIRIYLIDDHTVVRQSVRVMLETEPGLEVVGEAGEGRAGVRGIAATAPAVAIVDLQMPGLPGLATIPEILAASPRTGIIVFTMYDNASYVHEAMQAGASGYVLKSASKEELVRAVRAVHAGAGFLQAEVTKPLLRRLAADARSAGSAASLSLREIEVVELLAQGKSNKAIGQALGIAEETVKTHLKRLYEKLGAADRAQAVAIALRQQLID